MELEQQINMADTNQKDYYEKMKELESLEEAKRKNKIYNHVDTRSDMSPRSDASPKSLRSSRSSKSNVSIVSYHPEIMHIFATKQEANNELAKEKDRQRAARRARETSFDNITSSEKIIERGTINRDDITRVSLGSKKSNKTDKSKKSTTSNKNKNISKQQGLSIE